MPTLKKLKKLADKLTELQALAEEVREAHDLKQEWFNDRSEKWQQSEAGQEWEDFLNQADELITDIENIEIPDFE